MMANHLKFTKHRRIKQQPNKTNGFSQFALIIAILALATVVMVGIRVNLEIHKSALANNPTQNTQPTPQFDTNAEASPATQTVPPPQTTTPAPAPTPKPTLPAEPVFTTPIQINGNADCKKTTLDALKLLSQKAPAHYSTIIKYMSIIECAAQGSGMFAYENPPRYLVGDATRNAGAVWYAGTIAHDAGHSKLYHDYLIAHFGQSVPSDVWTGKSAEITCLTAQYDALSKIGGTQAQLDYINSLISDPQYQNIPYDQRWW